jgi:hypothetical protein
MAAQEVDDFLDDELVNQYIVFPPEVIAAIDQVEYLNTLKANNLNVVKASFMIKIYLSYLCRSFLVRIL